MPDVYSFAGFELDPKNYTLSQNGQRVALEPLVFDLLVLLVRHAGQVVTREELTEAVWQGRFVTDSTISTAVKSARKALGDDGQVQGIIKTVRGRGFRFDAELTSKSHAPKHPPMSEPALRPILMIQPIQADPETALAGLARVLDARLRTVLDRIPILQIASRQLAEIPTQQRREKQGITLMLEVQMFEIGDTLCLELALDETAEQTQVWARSFEWGRAETDVYRILQDVVSRLEPAIWAAMLREMRSVNRPVAGPLMLQAIGLLAEKGWHKSSFVTAQDLLRQAVALDPDEPLAHAYLALLTALGHRVGIQRDDPELASKAIAAADRALELDGNGSSVLGIAGCALADVGELDRALPILTKAVDVNPQNGQARTALGSALMLRRDYEAAIEHLQEGLRISPADNRLGVWGSILALAYLAQQDLTAARIAAAKACAEDDGLYMPRLVQAGIEVSAGSSEAAQRAVRECLRTRPNLHEKEVTSLLGQRLGTVVWAEARAQQGGTHASR